MLFPGTASAWVRVLPSYPLVQGLVDVSTYGAGWSETLPEIAALLADHHGKVATHNWRAAGAGNRDREFVFSLESIAQHFLNIIHQFQELGIQMPDQGITQCLKHAGVNAAGPGAK